MRAILLPTLLLTLILTGLASPGAAAPPAAPADAVATKTLTAQTAGTAMRSARAPFDLRRMRQQLARSAALDFQQKLRLRSQVNALIRDARSVRASDRAGWRGLRARYDHLLDRVIELTRSDERLRKALSSARELLWQEMVLHSRGRTIG